MLPIAVGGALAGMSILGGILGNQQTAKQLESNVNNIKEGLNQQWGKLQEQYNEANDNIALEMTTARFNGLKLSGSTTNQLVNRNIAGNTAVKQYNSSMLNKMFAQNALQKKAEDTWKSYGIEMDNARISANNAIYSAANQASQQMKSPLSIATSAVGAYMAGGTLATGISGMMGSETLVKDFTAGGYGGFSSLTDATKAGYTGGF